MRVARIRLAAEGDWPDFDVSFDDGSGLRCEAVEADRPRKRADEYRRAKKLGHPAEHGSEDQMLDEFRQIPAALTLAVQRKLDKSYPKDAAALVIYQNLGWGDQRTEVEPLIAASTRKGLQRFNSVWTLWSGRLYRTWPDGHITAEPQSSYSLGVTPTQ